MKRAALIVSVVALTAGPAMAQDAQPVVIGHEGGFTGPVESLAPVANQAIRMAAKEVSDSGKFLGGRTVEVVNADSTCSDAAAATASAEALVNQGVSGIVGSDCSGTSVAVLTNVAVPNGLGMISYSSTSPALSTIEDNGLFFRTAPSDARGGQIMSDILIDRGIKDVALTYTNNDYGKGFADSFAEAYEAAGGTISISIPHEDGKSDYSSEVASLAASGSDVLLVIGYIDQGGRAIIRNALDTGAFDTFALSDAMVGQPLVDALGEGLATSFGQYPGNESEGAERFAELFTAAGQDPGVSYSAEAYDAAALMLLSMQAANSTTSADWTAKVMDVANAPGEPILPGELGKALDLLAAGQDIDYVGATAVELIGPGESAGGFREVEFKDGGIQTIKFR
ncbi:Branched-chain amino acid ABC transporter, amino acid-binding protein [Rubellimicrobium mesophilum DSM 19309]|uniref:Branched-chain amino acid ABC transporter, amino acid-binding protein n=1 Tax=Rubellimicrobium mesophilum DSM 19309 TaxID=442562 RepID=A0A017HUH4_9RHOB|nr:ABC transporter substrate-binding protein [Rubellimicrobium mesophilum]EYD78132.1 Branched-chain amino acid ABC transporter, amino acid-binding protein [Rubellimicrobium mesophilum DSM 19309]